MAQRRVIEVTLDKRQNGVEACRKQASHFRQRYFVVDRKISAISKLIHDFAEDLPKEFYLQARVLMDRTNER